MDLFKKNIAVGVSVTPEIGLEVAQIDFVSKTILKYGTRQLNYDNNRKEIADLDIFKETLQDLLFELQIPKGSEIYLNLPAITFKVKDYPASLNEEQISNAVEEELYDHPIFKESDPAIDAVKLPNSTIQFNKIAYTAAQKVMLIEIAMQIKDLGYKLAGIDTTVNSTLNSLIFKERVDVNPGTSWVLLIVDNSYCRVIPMQGRNYVDCFEEKVSIGEVLGDAENYATVVNAIKPILKNLPSQYLCVVSETNIISAQVLAGQLQYNAPIIHQEANIFAKEPFLDVAAGIDDEQAKLVSLGVIGAGIYRDFLPFSNVHLNLYNANLGDVYLLEQPPVLKFGSLSLVMSLENMIKVLIPVAIIIIAVTMTVLGFIGSMIAQKNNRVAELEQSIKSINQFLKDNESVSAELFDEGDEIRIGLLHNKDIYTYFTIVGTEIPKKLWLTSLDLGDNITIEGQADNLESVYSFFRNIKDYAPDSPIKLQKLGMASINSNLQAISDSGSFDTDSVITSMNADYYQFKISDAPEVAEENISKNADKNKPGNKNNRKQTGRSNAKFSELPDIDDLD